MDRVLTCTYMYPFGAISSLSVQPLGPYILLSDEEFLEKTGFEKPKKDDPIVVTCLAGIRARTAQMALMAAGYTNVR